MPAERDWPALQSPQEQEFPADVDVFEQAERQLDQMQLELQQQHADTGTGGITSSNDNGGGSGSGSGRSNSSGNANGSVGANHKRQLEYDWMVGILGKLLAEKSGHMQKIQQLEAQLSAYQRPMTPGLQGTESDAMGGDDVDDDSIHVGDVDEDNETWCSDEEEPGPLGAPVAEPWQLVRAEVLVGQLFDAIDRTGRGTLGTRKMAGTF
eukprot:SAG22_NODE_3860_length_1495_cov_1.281519_2_plen_209_part_00